MSLRDDMKAYEERLMKDPLWSKVSSEHEVHKSSDPEYQPIEVGREQCTCTRCRIIRVKKLRAFRFSRQKCLGCGKLFTSIYTHCDKYRKD